MPFSAPGHPGAGPRHPSRRVGGADGGGDHGPVERFRAAGLLGLECYYSAFTPRQREIMLNLAEKFSLLVTAGSDYHGANKAVHLGQTGGPDPRHLQGFTTPLRTALPSKYKGRHGLPGRNAPMPRHAPWKYGKYSLQVLPCLDTFLRSKTASHLPAMDFGGFWLLSRRRLAPAKARRTKAPQRRAGRRLALVNRWLK